jgi:glycerol-1-phosphate dehydrogenase [NAD(P)+]
MNSSELLGKTFSCECGKTHSVAIREIVYSESAIPDAAAVCSRYLDGKSAVLVADRRTYEAAGQVLQKSLTRSGFKIASLLLPDGKDGRDPVCDDITLEYILDKIPEAGFFIAVGSGVISDLVKWLAVKTGKPYAVFATAASMNGYSSANIAPAIKGIKRVVDGTVPLAILASPKIIAEAPYKLTASGLGDVLAKPVSITDWRLNNFLFNEYFCPLCAQLITGIEPAYMNNPRGVLRREPEAIEALFNALIFSGLSMTMAGTSFPASGGEHLISHALDMSALERKIPHDYHGRQVGLGTIFACALYERIFALENPVFKLQTEPTNAAFWRSLAPVVEEEHTLKRKKAAEAIEQLKRKNWDELRALLRPTVRKASEIRACLKAAEAAYRISDIECDRARFLNAAMNCHQMRERYTVIDLARAVGILPKAAEEIIEEYLV